MVQEHHHYHYVISTLPVIVQTTCAREHQNQEDYACHSECQVTV